MRAIRWNPHFFPRQQSVKSPNPEFSRLLHLPPSSLLRPYSASSLNATRQISSQPAKTILPISDTSPEAERTTEEVLSQLLPCGFSRVAILTAASIGLAMLIAAMDAQKAAALGPEGPLVEEFWDNMRRYGLYVLTVSTGAIYTILEPIVEQLKNPISAILILVILGGGFFLVSQVLNAMVGITEFSYDYAY